MFVVLLLAVRASKPTAEPGARITRDSWGRDDGLSAFAPVRRHLFGIAYRMLGSSAEAESDVSPLCIETLRHSRIGLHSPTIFVPGWPIH